MEAAPSSVKDAFRPLVAANYRARHRKPAECGSGTSLVSFTFDDFPASAYRVGGKIVAETGAAATFYASTAEGAPGPLVTADLEGLVADGHELGCHTHRHLRIGDVPLRTYERDVLANIAALRSLVPGVALDSFSYPYGSATLRSQHRIGRHFASSRGTLDGINRGAFDLNHLRGTRVYHHVGNLAFLGDLIDDTAANGGWLIFYTHDVDDDPGEFGCTPGDLEYLVTRAVDAGTRLVSVRDAVGLLRPDLVRASTERGSGSTGDR